MYLMIVLVIGGLWLGVGLWLGPIVGRGLRSQWTELDDD